MGLIGEEEFLNKNGLFSEIYFGEFIDFSSEILHQHYILNNINNEN